MPEQCGDEAGYHQGGPELSQNVYEHYGAKVLDGRGRRLGDGYEPSPFELGCKCPVGLEAGEDFVGLVFHWCWPRLEGAVVKLGGAPSSVCGLVTEVLEGWGEGVRGMEIVSYRSAARNVTEGIPEALEDGRLVGRRNPEVREEGAE